MVDYLYSIGFERFLVYRGDRLRLGRMAVAGEEDRSSGYLKATYYRGIVEVCKNDRLYHLDSSEYGVDCVSDIEYLTGMRDNYFSVLERSKELVDVVHIACFHICKLLFTYLAPDYLLDRVIFEEFIIVDKRVQEAEVVAVSVGYYPSCDGNIIRIIR